MSVVGFDIGNETCVIAVAKQRGIDVLLNDESERENPALVSFGEKQRFIGCAGAASASMNPKSTISQVKRLIGRTFSEPSVQDDLKMLPFETSEGSDGGILLHLQYLKEKRTFTPIQILAMLLAHLKQIAEKNLEVQVGNCVIGIPSYFTALQRRAYLYAAEIAGLKPLKLMHDCTATGLGYGVYKTDFPQSGAANVAFVDVGHCDTQVAVISFVQGNMKVLSHAFDSSLGGRDFDEVLFRHFAAKFQEQNSIDVYSNVRACIRLRAACEKLKRVLSANPEAPLNIECLMDEKDMQGYIKREDFEELSSGLLERIRIPCQKALADSGLSVENVHNVELVGSGSRIPAITKILTSVFGQEPRRTLNASECVARGCALECAKLSPIFRVKEYEMQDCFPFSIGLASDDRPVSTLSDGMLFPKGNPFPCLKMLTLHQRDIFHLEASYTNLNELPSGVSTRISSYKIGPLGVSHVETAKLRIKIQLNLHGIVNIESASLIDDHVDDSSSNNSTSTISENVGPSNNEPSSKSKGPSGNEVKDLKQIPIDEDAYGGMTSNELSKAKEQELWYVQQDINMERTKEKKNALEAYVYETRNKLLDTYRSFATDSEKEGICNHLQQTENWLYEDGDDETEHVYTEKLEHLKKMVDPIDNRLKEEDARALSTRKLLGCIVEYRMAVISLPTTERDAVTIECNKAEHWLRDRSQQQDSLPKTSDPILLSSEINSKAETLNEICKQMIESKSSSPMPSPRPSPRPVESKSSSPMPSPRPVESKSSSPMPSPRPSPRPVEPKSFSPMPSPRPSPRPVDAGESERKATEKG